MADPVATPAVEAPPQLGPHEMIEPFTVQSDVPDTVPIDETPVIETPTEAPPVVETPAETAVRLKELRKADGVLDEDLIEKIVTEHTQTSAEMARARRLYASNPAFRVAWLKAIQADGYTPTPEEQAQIDAAEKPAAPAKTPPTPEQVRSYVSKTMRAMETALRTTGTATDADGRAVLNREGAPITTMTEMWEWGRDIEDTHIHKPGRDAEKTAREKAEKETQERTYQTQNVARWKPDFEKAAIEYPKLVVKANNIYGLWFVPGEEVLAEHVKALSNVYKNKPVTELIDMALKAVGRALPPKAKPATRPAVASTPTRPADSRPKVKLGPHEMIEPFTIVGG